MPLGHLFSFSHGSDSAEEATDEPPAWRQKVDMAATNADRYHGKLVIHASIVVVDRAAGRLFIICASISGCLARIALACKA